MKFFKQLIENNTGISAKSFFLVVVTIIGCILLIVPVVILMVEIIYNKTIQTDLMGLAAYVGAVSAIFASAGITKAWSEKFEHSHFIDHSNNEENQDNIDDFQGLVDTPDAPDEK